MNPSDHEIRPIPGLEKYSASKCGMIFRTADLRPMSIQHTGKGYRTSTLVYRSPKRKPFRVARLILRTFHPQWSEKLTADHINFVKDDDRLENLQPLTERENTLRKRAAL